MIDWYKEYKREKNSHELLWKLAMKYKAYEIMDEYIRIVGEEE